jgi:hypothetical protein
MVQGLGIVLNSASKTNISSSIIIIMEAGTCRDLEKCNGVIHDAFMMYG